MASLDMGRVTPHVEPKEKPATEKQLSAEPALTSTAASDSEAPQIGADDNGADGKGLGSPNIPRLRLIAVSTGIALGLFLSMLDSSIVATSLFTIAVEFGDVDSINWVALAYTLTYLSCAVLYARISDVVGRRVAFISAYVVFIVFSLACGFSQAMGQLIAFRAIQGLGGSGLYSVSMIILPELTPDHLQKHIASLVGLVIASAGVLGPVLGGILTQYTSWRWVFWINGPVGVFSLLVFLLAWPDKEYLPSLERRAWKDVDFVGAFLLIASAVLIVFPFQNASASRNWSSAVFLAPLLCGVLSLALLAVWQRSLSHRSNDNKSSNKLAMALPPVLLRNRVYVAAVLHTMLTGFPYLLCIYVFPVRFQVVYGRSALQAGLMLLPMLAASAAGTTLAGAINSGKEDRKVRFVETLLAACGLMILGCALETTASASVEQGKIEAKVLGFLVFVGLGFGLSAAGGTMLALTESPIWEHASAQGIMSQVRIFGGSIGIAASSAILGTKTRAVLAGGSVPPEALANLASDSLSPEQWALIRRLYTDALKEDMVVCCAVLASAAICTLGVCRRNRVSFEEMMKQRHREEGERRRAAVDPDTGSTE